MAHRSEDVRNGPKAAAVGAAHLYDEDFYAWTQAQAQALRTHFRGDNRLDVEHLAEEIEDLGGSQLQAVESFARQIMAHLLKLDHSAFDLPRRHWRSEIVAFRANMRRKLSPSIRRKILDAWPELYQDARDMAAASLDAEPDLGLRLPKLCPYDWEAVTTRDVMAEAGFPLSGGDDLTSKARPGKGKT
jgi:Domain of unknown function DUF29